MQLNHIATYQATINAPVEKLWDALTNPDLVKQYLFGAKQETDWKVGSGIIWTGEYEGTAYLDKAVVKEFIPNKKLSYSYLSSWSGLEDKPDNYLLVMYELQQVQAAVLLTITQSNYDAEKATHALDYWAGVTQRLKKLIE